MATRHSAVRLSVRDKPDVTPQHPQQLTNPGLRAAHYACAVFAPVLTSDLGAVTRSHRKLESRTIQKSEKPTEVCSRYPGNARPTGSAPAYLRNRGAASVRTQTASPATEKADACGEPPQFPGVHTYTPVTKLLIHTPNSQRKSFLTVSYLPAPAPG